MKKVLFSLGAIGITLAVLPMFAAFEAHVINVTAQIENALSVNTDSIDFGTVFPQEELERDIHVALSSSFLTEDRVDDVEYILRQKPKCGITAEGGTVLVGETATGEVLTPDGRVDCGEPPRQLETGESWGVLPSLCPYLSKHKDVSDDDGQEENELDAFHVPWTVSTSTVEWNDATGRLSKLEEDVEDWWVLDLKVPCFGDFCAQDWNDFVTNINPQANPDDFIQPIENEHKIFGCDIWIEVTGVSETPPPEPSE